MNNFQRRAKEMIIKNRRKTIAIITQMIYDDLGKLQFTNNLFIS